MKLTKKLIAVAAFVVLLGAAAVQTTTAADSSDAAKTSSSQKASSEADSGSDAKASSQGAAATSTSGTKDADSTKDASADAASLAPGEKPEPKVTESKASKGEKKRLVAYLEITNDQTGKAVRYGQVYDTRDSSGIKRDHEQSGWTGMTYNDIPSFPRFNLTPAEIKADVAAVGVTATNKQTWSITQHKVTFPEAE
ncbi:hypothetical protein [Lacticaseibacillus suihuaensis]